MKKYLLFVSVVMSIFVGIILINHHENEKILFNNSNNFQSKLVKTYTNYIDDLLCQRISILKFAVNFIQDKDRKNNYNLILFHNGFYIKNSENIYKDLNLLLLIIIGLALTFYFYKVRNRLHKSEDLLNLYAKSSNWGILICEESGKVIFINKEFEKIFSLPRKQFYNKNIKSLDLYKNYQKEFQYYESKNNNGYFYKIHKFKICKDDKIYLVSLIPLLKYNKIFKGLILNVNDITMEEKNILERKNQEKIILQNSKMISLGEMITAITHQWRQPLSTLLLLISAIEDEINNNNFIKSADYTKRARKNIELMNETISTFRNFYKETNSLNKTEFNIKNTIINTLEIIGPTIKSKGIEMEFLYDNKEKFNIINYETYIKQVLISMLINAKDALQIKIQKDYNFQAKIIINLSKISNYFVIELKDNANGIKTMHKNKIFTPFFTTKPDGTGLGLHLCKILIEDKIKGKLEFYSNINGTKFIIKIPDNLSKKD